MTPHFWRQRTGRTKFGDNSYLTYCSYHAFALMSTPQTYELSWLSYLSNILSPTGQKVGVKKFSARGLSLPLSKPWRRPCLPPVHCPFHRYLPFNFPFSPQANVSQQRSKLAGGLWDGFSVEMHYVNYNSKIWRHVTSDNDSLSCSWSIAFESSDLKTSFLTCRYVFTISRSS